MWGLAPPLVAHRQCRHFTAPAKAGHAVSVAGATGGGALPERPVSPSSGLPGAGNGHPGTVWPDNIPTGVLTCGLFATYRSYP